MPRCAFMLLVLTLASTSTHAADYNTYVLDAVNVVAQRAGGGYDAKCAFTQDLQYGPVDHVPTAPPLSGQPPGPTMCVAAVGEVIIESLNLWHASTKDTTPFTALSVQRWTGGTRLAFRPYLFQYKELGCRGAGDAFTKFGIGIEVPFDALRPGDFITFNRMNGGGHSTVFLGYLVAGSAEPTTAYSEAVIGFKYFSAQGKGAAGGVGFRNAYFEGHCPEPSPVGVVRDCRIRREGRTLLNCGRLNAPTDWRVEAAIGDIQAALKKKAAAVAPETGRSVDRVLEELLEEELTPDPDRFTGQTTD